MTTCILEILECSDNDSIYMTLPAIRYSMLSLLYHEQILCFLQCLYCCDFALFARVEHKDERQITGLVNPELCTLAFSCCSSIVSHAMKEPSCIVYILCIGL